MPNRLNHQTAPGIATANGSRQIVRGHRPSEKLSKNSGELRWMFLGKDGSHGPVERFFNERTKPVCPACTLAKLHFADDGEFELAEHTRYADEAESAQRGNAWPQAAALWQMAADKCQDANCRAGYEKNAARCREMACITKITDDET